MDKKVNWGIMGLGKISHKFAQGLEYADNSRSAWSRLKRQRKGI